MSISIGNALLSFHVETAAAETAETATVPEPVKIPAKRPYPFIKAVKRGSADLTWAAESHALFDMINGAMVRAGNSFSIVRPGWERWPLGIATDDYKPENHVALDERLLSECAENLTTNGVVMSGHGYNVAYGYILRHGKASSVGTHEVSTKLWIAHDHTGKAKMRASMCLYLDGKAIGAIVYTDAMHVAAQPGIFQGNIDAMIEIALFAQDAVLDTLRAAEAYILTDEDRKFLVKKGMRVPDGTVTALDALVEHHKGRNEKITWGVWSRRLNDEGLRAVLKLLPREIETTLDESIKNRRLSCVPQKAA